MIFEAFAIKLAQLMGVPPGASVRKQYPSTGGQSNVTANLAAENDYIQAIVDITVDDICIGDEPLSVNFSDDTPLEEQTKLKTINKAFNVIVKWVAKDLCINGYSVYFPVLSKDKTELSFVPYLDAVDFYLTKHNEVVAYDEKKKQLTGYLIYINFDKDSLTQIEDKKDVSKDILYKITPAPMQLRHATNAILGLTNAETSLAKLRMQLGRIPRWANVDIGTASGDTQDELIDTISSALNANSLSLNAQTAYTEFDDTIPVVPNRKGLGKPELQEASVNPNIKDLGDVDYWLSKINLIMRFPGSYVDFTKSLDATTVSLLRGDIRYAKLCIAVGSKIVSTNNNYVNDSNFSKWHPSFSLTKFPTSEDSDVIDALDTYSDLCSKVEDFINAEGTVELKLHRLKLLQDLLASSTTSPALQAWFEDYRAFITASAEVPEEELEESPPSESEGFEESTSEIPEPTSSPEGPPSPVEIIQPSTNV